MDFHQQPGFEVTGVVPDANGFGRPDILMSKRVAGPRQADAFTA
jgi:aminoglycoside 6'-N-acetyltransferase I